MGTISPSLDELLERTSRTFALSIPMLPEPVRREVGVAYLLLRIADTFEDATRWTAAERTTALETFRSMMVDHDAEAARMQAKVWVTRPPMEHEGYIRLLGQTDAVLEAFFALAPGPRGIIGRHVVRMVEGMMPYAAADDGPALASIEELRAYCYVAAGIVGEMLTELFVHGQAALRSIEPYLASRARYFGEALQLTNILKDASADRREGRHYLPPSVVLTEVFQFARDDLALAAEYVGALESAKADAGLLAFVALPVLLACATLNRVEADGAGAKLTRDEVFALIDRMRRQIERGEPLALEVDRVHPSGTD